MDNHIYHWEAGDQAATDAAFARAAKVVELSTFYPPLPSRPARNLRHRRRRFNPGTSSDASA